MQFGSKVFQERPEECLLQTGDLAHIPVVEQVLKVLNDPYASAVELAELIGRFPAFAARCRREAYLRRPTARLDHLEIALQILGTRGLERVLLNLLEEMTTLKAELESGS